MNFALSLPFSFWSPARGGSDWPEWRGLHRTGVTSEEINTSWPPDGPKVLWRASIGTGFSSMSISQGKLYTTGNANEQETIWCLDALNGKEVWKHSYPSPLGSVYYEGGPGSTPTVESNRVYNIGKWGQILCLDATNGAVIWQHDLRSEGIKSNRWGFAGSPLIWHELVIFNAGSSGIALERNDRQNCLVNWNQPDRLRQSHAFQL